MDIQVSPYNNEKKGVSSLDREWGRKAFNQLTLPHDCFNYEMLEGGLLLGSQLLTSK